RRLELPFGRLCDSDNGKLSWCRWQFQGEYIALALTFWWWRKRSGIRVGSISSGLGNLAGPAELVSENLDVGKALAGIFLQTAHDYLLDIGRAAYSSTAWGWRHDKEVLVNNFMKCAIKRPAPAEPFVNDYPKRVLIAGPAWSPLKLLRRGIEYRSFKIFQGC